MSLSDRMAIMQHGNVLQIGNPVEIYEKPNNEYIAKFIGTANIFQLESHPNDDQSYLSPELNIKIKTKNIIDKTKCLIRPEKIKIKKNETFVNSKKPNQCIGIVKEVAYLGSYTKYLIQSNNFNFYVFHPNNSISEELNIKWDDKVECSWDKGAIYLL